MAAGIRPPALPPSPGSRQRTPGLSAHPEGPRALPPASLCSFALLVQTVFFVLSFSIRPGGCHMGLMAPCFPRARGGPRPVGSKTGGPEKREARGGRARVWSCGCTAWWCVRDQCVWRGALSQTLPQSPVELWPPRPSPAPSTFPFSSLSSIPEAGPHPSPCLLPPPALPPPPGSKALALPALPPPLFLSFSLCFLANCQPIGSGKSIPS